MTTPRSFRPARIALLAAVFAVALAVSVPVAHAGTLYSTGFEDPPFTLGNISGQDGWSVFGPGTSLVENTLVQSGSQAVSVDGSAASQSGPYHGDFSAGPVIELSAGIYIASSSSRTEWQFAGLSSGLAPFLGGIDIRSDGDIVAITNAYPVIGTWTYNTWNNVDLLFDITSQSYKISINGVVLASNVAFCGDNGPCAGGHVSSYGDGIFDTFGGGNDTGYMDNYKVVENPPSTTPEPGSFVLFVTAILGSAGIVRRKLRT